MRLPKLFTVRDKHITFHKEEAKAIKEFKDLIFRDKSPRDSDTGNDKQTALKEMIFLYLFVDMYSPFKDLGDDERLTQSIKAADLAEGWKVDSMIEAAIERYKSIQYVPAYRAILEIKEGLSTSYEISKILNQQNKQIIKSIKAKMNDFKSDNVKLAELAADNQMLLKNIKDMVDTSTQVEKTLKNLTTMEERFLNEVQEQNIRGGLALGNRELPKEQRQ